MCFRNQPIRNQLGSALGAVPDRLDIRNPKSLLTWQKYSPGKAIATA
jgi:hypothetical protein